MTRKNVWLAALAALSLAAFARADDTETVKLAYQLKPGLELMFNSSGTLKYHGKIMNTFDGAIRCGVGEVDEKSGAASVAEMRSETQEAVLAFCRVDSAGKTTAQWMRSHVLPTPLPAEAVAVGAKWKGVMDFRGFGAPLNVMMDAKAELVQIKAVDGHKCAVIRTRLNDPLGGKGGRFTISGEMETRFDVEAGVCRSQHIKIHADHPSGSNNDLDLSTSLASSRVLPEEQAAVEAQLIKRFEAVLGDIHAGAVAKAQDRLNEVDQDKLPDEWKAGFKSFTRWVAMLPGAHQPQPNAAPGVVPAPAAH